MAFYSYLIPITYCDTLLISFVLALPCPLFLLLGEQIPIYHTVWHVFVLVASVMHWFAVFHYTVQYEVPKPSSVIK